MKSTVHAGESPEGHRFVLPNVIVAKGKLGDGDTFEISYNNYDTDIYGCTTTALLKNCQECFYVLNGDHREAYKELVPFGYQTCVDYFVAHIDQIAKYSEKPGHHFKWRG